MLIADLSSIRRLKHVAIGGTRSATRSVVQARRPTRLPSVLMPEEVERVLALLTGDRWLVAMLHYGAGKGHAPRRVRSQASCGGAVVAVAVGVSRVHR